MTADPIFRILSGYRVSAALKAAVELDLFTAIARGKRTAAALSAARGGTPRSIRILLDALAANAPNVLRKSAGGYALTPLSHKFLVRGPAFIGPLASLFAHPAIWSSFGDLASAVRAGRSVLESNAHTPGQEFWEDFARATSRETAPKARRMIRALGRLPRPCDILDIACGSGGYGATFAREVPGARVSLFDQAYVLRQARRLVREKVRWLPGDLFKTPFGGPYDVIVASHVFHHFDRAECARLARKVAAALKPGGRLVLQEFVPDEARRRKPFPLLFAVTMLVWTRAGDAYRLSDYREWFRAAGLERVALRPSLPPADLILATKPAR